MGELHVQMEGHCFPPAAHVSVGIKLGLDWIFSVCLSVYSDSGTAQAG